MSQRKNKKVIFQKNVKKVPKKYQKNYEFNNRGNCYFVDTYDKYGNMTWSGMYRSKKSASIVANTFAKTDRSTNKVVIQKYTK